jgi:hypothetical protein
MGLTGIFKISVDCKKCGRIGICEAPGGVMPAGDRCWFVLVSYDTHGDEMARVAFCSTLCASTWLDTQKKGGN